MENSRLFGNDALPDTALEALKGFLSSVSVERLSKQVRNIFLCHIHSEIDTPSLDMEERILQLQALFDLFDILEKVPEQQARGSSFL